MRGSEDNCPTPMSTSTLKCALLIAVLLAASAGHAADKPKEASFGKGKASGPTLTREQLRQCLSQQSQAQLQDAELVKLQTALNADKAQIVRSGEVLKEQGVALDLTQPELVAAYNDQVLARDKAIDDLQARGAQFNARAETAKTQREAFANACNGRSYFETDEIAIQKGR